MTKARPFAALAAVLIACTPAVVWGSPADVLGPQPPCGAESIPAYPDLEHSPVIKVWDRSQLGRNWAPPACLGWSQPGFTTLISTAARFRANGPEELLRRVGDISRLGGIRYWSTTHQSWRTRSFLLVVPLDKLKRLVMPVE